MRRFKAGNKVWWMGPYTLQGVRGMGQVECEGDAPGRAPWFGGRDGTPDAVTFVFTAATRAGSH